MPDSLPTTVYTVDLDGRIVAVEHTRTKSDAAAPEAAPPLGAAIWDVLGEPTARVPLEQAMAGLHPGDAPVSWELPLRSSAGERALLVQVAPSTDGAAGARCVVTTVDLTASQRAREQKQRLTATADVSAGIAHELRNPLFGISSAAQLLRFRVKDDPIVEKNVGRILREVDRLNAVVTGLLEYSRPEPLHRVPGDPDALWDEVLEGQRGRLESRALLLHRTRAEPPAQCPIDGGQLAQVLLNLLVNATDAAPPGTDLTLQSSVLPNGAWRCRLHNGGAEIPPDVLPRVFDLFLSTKPGGTGIGLALCRRIVEQHEGTLALESAPEHGTTATLVLPGVPGRHPPHVSGSARAGATSPASPPSSTGAKL